MSRISAAKKAALVLAPVVIATSGTAPAAASGAEEAESVAFSISALSNGETRTLKSPEADSAQAKQLKQMDFSVEQEKSGETAVVDRSSAGEGITVS
ncbi:hypothetical protein [Streptomyces sp. NPDC059452]|uniref:hypothetical protein n=1 Tax=Streptomyces sp. NPDC059452 TaxID=3346835 RepID=UPI0036AB5951